MSRSVFWVMGTSLVIATLAAQANATTSINTTASGASWDASTSWTPATIPNGDYYVKWDDTSGGAGSSNVKIDFGSASKQITRLAMIGSGSNTELYFGSDAGTLSVTNTGSSNFFGIANATGAQGKITMDGGSITMGTTGTTWMGLGSLYVPGTTPIWASGSSGAATVTVNTGATINAVCTTGGISLGSTVGSSNTQTTLNIAGGTVNANAVRFQRYGASTISVSNGGTLNLLGFDFGQLSSGALGTYTANFDGATLKARSASAIPTFMTGLTHAYIKEGGLTVNTDGTAGTGVRVTVGQSLEHGGVSAVDGGLTKTGLEALVLNGANTYTGLTTINKGALLAQNSSALGTTDTGTTIASGAALWLAGGISIGNEALTLSGDPVSYTGALRNVVNDNTYGGLITLGSNTRIYADTGTLTLSNAGTITGNGYSLVVGGPGNVSIASVIGTGAGSLLKSSTGTGAVTLSAANTYSGATSIGNGTLILTTTGSIDNSALITGNAGGILDVSAKNDFHLHSGQSLQGLITVVGDLTVDGAVAPGYSGLGELAFSNALHLAGVTSMEIAKATTTSSDLLNITGSSPLTYGGTLTVADSSSVVYAAGDRWNLFDASSFSGSFSTINLPTLSNGLTWDTTQLSIDGTIGVKAVPEPGALALAMAGVIGLLAYAWRRRN
jgi:autotransporter-associated beta strand protein